MLLTMMPLLSCCGRKKLETVSHGLVHSTSTSFSRCRSLSSQPPISSSIGLTVLRMSPRLPTWKTRVHRFRRLRACAPKEVASAIAA